MSKTGERLVAIALAAGSYGLCLYIFLAGNPETVPAYEAITAPCSSVSGIAFDGASLWITADGEPKLFRVDATTGAVQEQFSLPFSQTGGNAWDGSSLWQLAYKAKTIHKLDPSTGNIIATIPSPGQGMCCGMTFDGQHLWLANFDEAKTYRIDQENGGKILHSIDSIFEATGLAWDGAHLWTGILVGTKNHEEVTPFTGFVQQNIPGNKKPLRALPVQGVGPGTSNWSAQQKIASRFWWYDGAHKKIQAITFSPPESHRKVQLAASGLATLMTLSLCLLVFRRSR